MERAKSFEEIMTPERKFVRDGLMNQQYRRGGYDGHDWYERHLHNRAIENAKQEDEVASKMEQFQQLAKMIEELKGAVEGKVEAIHQFVRDNGLDHIVGFDTWGDYMNIHEILDTNLESETLQWISSDHTC